jgi:hypothetical protein
MREREDACADHWLVRIESRTPAGAVGAVAPLGTAVGNERPIEIVKTSDDIMHNAVVVEAQHAVKAVQFEDGRDELVGDALYAMPSDPVTRRQSGDSAGSSG